MGSKPCAPGVLWRESSPLTASAAWRQSRWGVTARIISSSARPGAYARGLRLRARYGQGQEGLGGTWGRDGAWMVRELGVARAHVLAPPAYALCHDCRGSKRHYTSGPFCRRGVESAELAHGEE